MVKFDIEGGSRPCLRLTLTGWNARASSLEFHSGCSQVQAGARALADKGFGVLDAGRKRAVWSDCTGLIFTDLNCGMIWRPFS